MADMILTLAIQSELGPEGKRLLDHLNQIGSRGSDGMRRIEQTANAAGQAIDGVGRFAKFTLRVLEAFVLYKGFVFLKTQAEQFIGSLIDMEHQVAIVQTQLNHFGQDFRGRIGREIIAIGQETGLVFADLAKTEFEIVSANIAVADSYEILRLSAKAAVAGGLREVELAFNAALSQVNAFSLGVDQFDEVFDKQFNLIKRGIFTYQQFATVVGTVSESFASMGQDVETTNAALAAISQIFTGKQLERGATGLRNAVLRIGEAQEDFEALGVAVVDVNGNFRNFIDIGKDLNAMLAGLTEARRFEVIRGLFPDERERRGIEAFLDQIDEAERFMVEQRFSVGALEEANKTVTESLSIQAAILRNDLTPAVESIVGLFSGLTKSVNTLDDLMPGFTSNLFSLATALAAVKLATFGLAQTGRPTITTAFPAGMAGQFAMMDVALGQAKEPRRLTTAGRIGVAGLGALTAFGGFSAGRERGTDATSVAGLLAGGAAGGFMMGGPTGALVGSAAALGGLIIGEIFEKEAEDVAKPFAEAFREALVSNAGDVAAAFSQAIAESRVGQSVAFEDVARAAGRGRTGFRDRRTGRFVATDNIREAYNVLGASAQLERSTGGPPAGVLVPQALAMAFRAQQGVDEDRLRNIAIASRVDNPDAFVAQAKREASLAAISEVLSGSELEDVVIGLVDTFDNQTSALEAWGLMLDKNIDGLAELTAAQREAGIIVVRSAADLEKAIKDISEAVVSPEAIELLRRAGMSGEADRLESIRALSGKTDLLSGLAQSSVPGASLALRLLTGTAAPDFAADPHFEEAIALIQAFSEEVSVAREEVDGFADSIARNRLEMDLLSKQAAVQNRELTAEELNHIKRLDLVNTQLEIQRLALEQANAAMRESAELTEAENAQRRREMHANAFAGADLAQLRLFDRLTGGFVAGSNPVLAQRAFQSFIQQQATQFSGANQRGGLTVVFYGEVAPSEIDQDIHRLERMGSRFAGQFAGV